MCTRLPFISWSIVGVPSSQALPGYRITAPPSVCVPDVIGTLVVWIHKKKKVTHQQGRPQNCYLRSASGQFLGSYRVNRVLITRSVQ